MGFHCPNRYTDCKRPLLLFRSIKVVVLCPGRVSHDLRVSTFSRRGFLHPWLYGLPFLPHLVVFQLRKKFFACRRKRYKKKKQSSRCFAWPGKDNASQR